MTPLKKLLAESLFDLNIIEFKEKELRLNQEDPTQVPSPIYFNFRTEARGGRVTRNLMRTLSLALFDVIWHAKLQFRGIGPIPEAAEPYAAFLIDNYIDRMEVSRLLFEKAQTPDGKRCIKGIRDKDDLMPGHVIVLLDDVVSAGHSKREALCVSREAGYVVTDAVVIVDREQGGKEALAKEGCTLHSVFTLTELLTLGLQTERISATRYEKVVAYSAYMNGRISRQDYLAFPS